MHIEIINCKYFVYMLSVFKYLIWSERTGNAESVSGHFAHNSNSIEICLVDCNSIAGHLIKIVFAQATTAQLSCHVQNFVAITLLESRWKQNEISIKF